MTCDTRELFMRQRRFDLIFKWLFVVKPGNAYVRKAYLESIRAFNGFVEGEPSDGIPKDTPGKFCQSFNRLIQSMRKDGFCNLGLLTALKTSARLTVSQVPSLGNS